MCVPLLRSRSRSQRCRADEGNPPECGHHSHLPLFPEELPGEIRVVGPKGSIPGEERNSVYWVSSDAYPHKQKAF